MANRKMPLDPKTKFYVKSWDTRETLYTFDTANAAKRKCKALGGYELDWLQRFTPYAYVEADYIVINPYTGAYDLDNYITERLHFYNPRKN